MDFVRQLREQGELATLPWMPVPMSRSSVKRKIWIIYLKSFGQRYRLIVSKTKDLSQDDSYKTCGKLYWAG